MCRPRRHVLERILAGCMLGLLMFMLYVNDIGAKISHQTTKKLFADDLLFSEPPMIPLTKYRLNMTLTTCYNGLNNYIEGTGSATLCGIMQRSVICLR